MNRLLLTIAAATVACASVAAHADSGMKPGLWEMRIVKNVVDGQDTSAAMAGLSAKMQEQMKNMPPERQAQMQAMMKQHGVALGGDGSIQMCLTEEMAKRDVPVVDKDGACQPSNVKRSGKRMSYDIACTSRGSTTTGKGEATISGDTVLTKTDMTTKSGDDTHQIQAETEMKFIKSDCGDVKPLKANRS